MNQQTRYSGL